MLWHITLIEYTASETGSTFSIALNAPEQAGGSMHNFQQKKVKNPTISH